MGKVVKLFKRLERWFNNPEFTKILMLNTHQRYKQENFN